ncbi:MAG: hypothetical protein LKK19_05050, partial [Bacteroidales bacterium]|nr:hypothetical protein [Bacteroidales bacterium]
MKQKFIFYAAVPIAIFLAASCKGGKQKDFVRVNSADSLFSAEIPSFCEKSFISEDYMAFTNEKRLTFVSISSMDSFDSTRFKAMVSKISSRSPMAQEAYEPVYSSATAVICRNAKSKSTEYYIHRKEQESDYFIAIVAPDKTVSENDVKHICNSIRENDPTITLATSTGGRIRYGKERFSVDSTLHLKYDRQYAETYNGSHKSEARKLIGSYRNEEDTLDITNSTFVNINVYDVSGILNEKAICKTPIEIYIQTLDDAGTHYEMTEFKDCPAVISTSAQKMGSTGGKMPSKELYVQRDSITYLIRVSSMTDLKHKFDRTV